MDKIIKLPTIDDLVLEHDKSYKESAYSVLLNQEPPKAWVKEHPIAKMEVLNEKGVKVKVPVPYLPIDKIEYLATRIYKGYKSEIKDAKVVANSILITVKVTVINPLTGKEESHDGIGAVAIQTDSGKGAMDWNFAKSNGVQLAAPAAETYAIKDAFEKFGRVFGRDLTRQNLLGYESLLKDKGEEITLESLKILVAKKFTFINPEMMKNVVRILDTENENKNPETKSFVKLFNDLTEL